MRFPFGPLLAMTLGVAAFDGWTAEPKHDRIGAADDLEHIVVTAGRLSDPLMEERLVTALQRDPYIFSDHVTVRVENGIVRLRGTISDLSDLYRILRLARQIAGKGRVANEIEFVPLGSDAD
jgi:osmotically-inducible protein OsmY